MAAVQNTGEDQDVRVNDVDWDILAVMADGRRYTQAHLYNDVDELDEYSDDWIRKRVSHLRDVGLIEKVGTSTMYTISDYGLAALDLREEYQEDDLSPVEFGDRVRDHANNGDHSTE